MSTIFVNIPNEEKKNGISLVCQRLGIEMRVIGNEYLNVCLGDIIIALSGENRTGKAIKINNNQVESAAKAPALYNMPELMIFNGFDSPALDGFLNMYKMTGLPKIPLKAVVTPYNIKWTLYELIEHLKEESGR